MLRPRADAHSLTAGLGGASPSPGWCFFFCCGPARTGVVFFFLLWPRPDAHSLTVGWGDFGKVRVVFFFCCGPAGSFLVSLKRPGGAAAKKNTTGRCFFFCCGPARTLTHSLRAWVVPPPRRGGVFFCCGPARTGVVFFFLLWPRPDAHSLTVGWGDFGKVRVVFFFLLWPRPVFLGNSKKCLVYYIGSKKTRRGHNKNKNTTSFMVATQQCPAASISTYAAISLASTASPIGKLNLPGTDGPPIQKRFQQPQTLLPKP